jgi:hypothetical protein
MASEPGMRQCPFCKEEIKADAVKCKHCRSRVVPEIPAHGGVCPFCKEEINPDGIKCKHCGSNVGPGQSACCDHCAGKGGSFPDPLDPRFVSELAKGGNCTECFRTWPFGWQFQLCCTTVWIPFLGLQKVCYPVPCAGTVIVAES